MSDNLLLLTLAIVIIAINFGISTIYFHHLCGELHKIKAELGIEEKDTP